MVEFNLSGLPNNEVHISGFRGEDGSIVELNAMFLVNTVFSCQRQPRTKYTRCLEDLVSAAESTLGG
jgi:hypothetical protein